MLIFLALFASGCAGPSTPASVVVSMKPWQIDGLNGLEVSTPHYRLLTTVRDPVVVDRFTRVMEAAHTQYAALIPPKTSTTRPLEVFLFATPEEWEAFTRRLTGRDASVYLSVGPGGYAYGDRFVCWLFNENDLWGVAAHEGFHQYAARHLPLRLPPALEEGLAATFESIAVTDRSVTMDRQSNPRRQRGLADGLAAKALLPIGEVVRLHAGDVAGRELVVREAFYGQCWALARLFLESPRYADGLRRMLTDLRDGNVTDSTLIVGKTGKTTLYYPAAVLPLLGKYLTGDWTEFERTYTAWVSRLASANYRAE